MKLYSFAFFTRYYHLERTKHLHRNLEMCIRDRYIKDPSCILDPNQQNALTCYNVANILNNIDESSYLFCRIYNFFIVWGLIKCTVSLIKEERNSFHFLLTSQSYFTNVFVLVTKIKCMHIVLKDVA